MGLAALVQDNRRNAANAVLARGCRIGVDVELGDRDLAAVFLGDFVQHRCEHLARAAPFGPEIDQHRMTRLQHVLVEGGVGNVFDGCTHGKSSRGERAATQGGASFGVTVAEAPDVSK